MLAQIPALTLAQILAQSELHERSRACHDEADDDAGFWHGNPGTLAMARL